MKNWIRSRNVLVTSLTAVLLVGCGGSNSQQGNTINVDANATGGNIAAATLISYTEFKSNYTPHDKLLDPTNVVVPVFGKMEPSGIAPLFDAFVNKADAEEASKTTFVLLATSIPRTVCGQALDLMSQPQFVKGINYLKDEWALDLLYYVSETTFNSNAAQINAINTYSQQFSGVSAQPSSSSSSSTSAAPQASMQGSSLTLSDFYQHGWFVSGAIMSAGQNVEVNKWLAQSQTKLNTGTLDSYETTEILRINGLVSAKYGPLASHAFILGNIVTTWSGLESQTLRDSFIKFKSEYIAILGDDSYLSSLDQKLKADTLASDVATIMTELDNRLKRIPLQTKKLSLDEPFQLGWFVMGSISSQGQNIQVSNWLNASIATLELDNIETYEISEINKMTAQVKAKHGDRASNAFQLGVTSGMFGVLEGDQWRDAFAKFKSYYLFIFGEDEYIKLLSTRMRSQEPIKNSDVMNEISERLKKLPLR